MGRGGFRRQVQQKWSLAAARRRHRGERGRPRAGRREGVCGGTSASAPSGAAAADAERAVRSSRPISRYASLGQCVDSAGMLRHSAGAGGGDRGRAAPKGDGPPVVVVPFAPRCHDMGVGMRCGGTPNSASRRHCATPKANVSRVAENDQPRETTWASLQKKLTANTLESLLWGCSKYFETCINNNNQGNNPGNFQGLSGRKRSNHSFPVVLWLQTTVKFNGFHCGRHSRHIQQQTFALIIGWFYTNPRERGFLSLFPKPVNQFFWKTSQSGVGPTLGFRRN